MKMGSTKIFSLLILSISLMITNTIAQSSSATCGAHTFNNNQLFSTCIALSELSSFLYWTYNSTTGTASIAFRVTGVSSASSWIAWGLNPTGSGMVGTQALVAYQNSSSTVPQGYTSSVTSTASTLAQSSLSFRADNISATSGTNEMTIFATIRPPSTTVNHVWQVGPLRGGAPGAHPLNAANTRSSGSINFLDGQATSGAATVQRLGRKNVHGVLNAISWGILMPLGAIIARYVKVFPSADPAWFYLHVTCQIVAYILGVAGWGTGLKLGSDSPGIVFTVHRNIGIALFCLATLQVFALLLRPNKDHKYRLYWKVYHHGIGYVVIILSIINIYQGLDKVLQPEKKWKRIYSGIIIALGAIALVLEAFTWTIVLKKKKNEQLKHGNHANGTNGYANSYAQPAL